MLTELQTRVAVESLKFTLQRKASAGQSEGPKTYPSPSRPFTFATSKVPVLRYLFPVTTCTYNTLFLLFAIFECIAFARRFISVHQQILSISSAHYTAWQEAFLSRLHLHLHQSQQCKVSHRNSTTHHNNLHAEAAVAALSSLEVEEVLDVVAVEDRAIPTLNLSATIRVRHLVKEMLILEKDMMLHLRGRPHEGIPILRR
jgi:hypothetical protein